MFLPSESAGIYAQDQALACIFPAISMLTQFSCSKVIISI